MNASSFTPEEFEAAIASLTDKGIRPTVRKLRQLLGSGSHETISPMLANWRSRQQAPAVTTAVPAAVQAKAAEWVALVWATANAQARTELDTVRQRLQQQHTELAEELADARLDLRDMEVTVGELQRHLERERLLREDESRRRAEAEAQCTRLAELEAAVTLQRGQLERLQSALGAKATEAVHHRAVAETLQRQMGDLLQAMEKRSDAPAAGHGANSENARVSAAEPAAGGRRERGRAAG